MKNINVGIDLGTTYSVVACFDEATSKINVLKNEIDNDTTPSVVAMDNGKWVVGQEAKDLQASGNTDSASFYKSQMGEKNFSAYIDGTSYSAEDLSSFFLKGLKEQVEAKNDVHIEGAVITCPAYFNEAQRQATLKAGVRAGLKVLRIINEPTAAIIAYGLNGAGKRNIMVYDLGGGTFDVTIAEVNGGTVKCIATNGNHQLGGRDWDRTLIDYVCSKFEEEFGTDVTAHPEDFNELMIKCEKAKQQLTTLPSTTISIQCEGLFGKYTVTREEFEEMTEGLLQETILLSESCFNEIGNGFSWKNIDEVVLVGGSTRMPQVSNTIENIIGKKPVIIGSRVDTIVAAGAAMQAAIEKKGSITLNPAATGMSARPNSGFAGMTLTLNQNSIIDITSHSLGMLVFRDEANSDEVINSIIIPKNSTVDTPFEKEYTFAGEKMEIYVLQGETEDAYDAQMLYKYEVSGFNSGKNDIVVSFLYNKNGTVEVETKIKNGKALTVTKSEITESLQDIVDRLVKAKHEAKKVSEINVCFAIDVSGSMEDEGITAAKDAIRGFMNEIDLSHAHVTIQCFANTCTTLLENSSSSYDISRAINQIECNVNGTGWGTSADPFSFFENTVGSNKSSGFSLSKMFSKGSSNNSSGGNNLMIVLTDGAWSEPSVAQSSSSRVRNTGVTVYAIGVADADFSFLQKIASPGCGQKIDFSQLSSTFQAIGSGLASAK